MTYHCKDHEPYKEAFGSYGIDSRTGDIRYFEIKNPNVKTCQYQYSNLGIADKGCEGCCHKDSHE